MINILSPSTGPQLQRSSAKITRARMNVLMKRQKAQGMVKAMQQAVTPPPGTEISVSHCSRVLSCYTTTWHRN